MLKRKYDIDSFAHYRMKIRNPDSILKDPSKMAIPGFGGEQVQHYVDIVTVVIRTNRMMTVIIMRSDKSKTYSKTVSKAFKVLGIP